MTEGGELPPRSASAPLVEAATNLFQFFCESIRLRIKDITSTDQYERDGNVIWLAELPPHPAVQSAHEVDEVAFEDKVMIVEKVAKADPPIPPQNVRPWLGEFDHRNAGSNPVLLDERPEPVAEDRDEEDEEGGPDGRMIKRSDFPDVEPAYTQWRPQWMAWAG